MSESPHRDPVSIEKLRTEIEDVYRANEALAAERDQVCRADERIASDYHRLLTSRLDSARQAETLLRNQLAANKPALVRQKRKTDEAVAAAAKLLAELQLRSTELDKSQSALTQAQAMLSRIFADVEQEDEYVALSGLAADVGYTGSQRVALGYHRAAPSGRAQHPHSLLPKCFCMNLTISA